MKNLKLLTKVNYWLIIICFCLPFMVDTCIHDELHPAQKKHTVKDTFNLKQDNVADSSKLIKNNIKEDEQQMTGEEKITWLRKGYNFIISPADDTISGIGVIIYRAWFTVFMIPAVCLLLTILSLILIYQKRPKYFLLFIFSGTCFILLFLLLAIDKFKISDLLVGFWAMIILYLSSTILNWKSYKNRGNQIANEQMN